MSEIRGLGRETLIYMLASIGQAGAGLAAFYYFSRLLTPDQYGYYFVALAAAEVVAGIAIGWINFTLIRQYPALEPSERPKYLGQLLATYLVTMVVLLVVTTLASAGMALFHQDAALPWLVYALVIPMGTLSLAQWLFRTQRRPGDWLITLLTISFGRLLLGILLLTQVERTGRILLITQSVSIGVALVWSITRLRESIAFSRDSFSWRAVKPVLDYGLPLAMVNTGSMLMNSAGRLILGLLKGTAAVGIFSPANQLARMLLEMGARPLTMAFVPVSYRVFEREGEAAAMRVLHLTSAVLITIITGLGLTLYLLREALIGALFDPRYAAAADLIVYLVPALALAQLHPLLIKSFEFSQKTQALTWYTLWAGLINVGLNFALIPFMAETGAAIAALATYIIYCVSTYIGAQRHYRWDFPWYQPLAIALPIAVLVVIHWRLPAPHGLIMAAVYTLGYILVYALTAILVLRLGPPLFRQQLDFLRDIFLRRSRRPAA
ncbi:lipopolysaccharide biosynthesis protein [bacterium]|nr:lipopolysaccharide biosynthesis protein [bacterium]